MRFVAARESGAERISGSKNFRSHPKKTFATISGNGANVAFYGREAGF
jgi:hypothetical protein